MLGHSFLQKVGAQFSSSWMWARLGDSLITMWPKWQQMTFKNRSQKEKLLPGSFSSSGPLTWENLTTISENTQVTLYGGSCGGKPVGHRSEWPGKRVLLFQPSLPRTVALANVQLQPHKKPEARTTQLRAFWIPHPWTVRWDKYWLLVEAIHLWRSLFCKKSTLIYSLIISPFGVVSSEPCYSLPPFT